MKHMIAVRQNKTERVEIGDMAIIISFLETGSEVDDRVIYKKRDVTRAQSIESHSYAFFLSFLSYFLGTIDGTWALFSLNRSRLFQLKTIIKTRLRCAIKVECVKNGISFATCSATLFPCGICFAFAWWSNRKNLAKRSFREREAMKHWEKLWMWNFQQWLH